MANEKKRFKLTASKTIAPGFLNISVAGVGNFGKVKDPLSGKMVDGVIYATRLEAGQEIEVDVIEMPERLQAAQESGALTIVAVNK